MKQIKFAWDSAKAASNAKKHGISFEEAKTVFDDDNARLIDETPTIRTAKRDLFCLA